MSRKSVLQHFPIAAVVYSGLFLSFCFLFHFPNGNGHCGDRGECDVCRREPNAESPVTGLVLSCLVLS